MRNIGKKLSNVFFQIGNSINIAKPKDLDKYKYNYKNDEEALKSDWEEVGRDIEIAMKSYKDKK